MIFNEVFVTYDDNDDVKETFGMYVDKVVLEVLLTTKLFKADVKLVPDLNKFSVISLSWYLLITFIRTIIIEIKKLNYDYLAYST